MKQSTLHTFFNIKNKTRKDHGYFIYCPSEKRAIFSQTVEDTDKFLCATKELELFIRGQTDSPHWKPTPLKLNSSVPLLKSNLQKAIRRQKHNIAIKTTLALLIDNSVELFRRLAIIMIEDLCLMSSMPVIIWFMVAGNNYNMTEYDTTLVLNIVSSMTKCQNYYETRGDIDLPTIKPEELNKNSVVKSVAIRRLYGGMEGDMKMLDNAVSYYYNNSHLIETATYGETFSLEPSPPKILSCAFDFHVYPDMLNDISYKTGIDIQRVKEIIWHGDSAYNTRKPYTIENIEKTRETPEWQKVATERTKLSHY